MANVLIATLGDSPIVVTSMYDLLTKPEGPPEERTTIDRVVVLYSKGKKREDGYMAIDEGFKGRCPVEAVELSIEDADTDKNCFIFLHELFNVLEACKDQGDTVYLSLAGGRKNMAVLAALVAPFFSCVKKLYQVIDGGEFTDRANFIPANELVKLYESNKLEQLRALMHPDIKKLYLVPIPFDNALRVPASYVDDLLQKSPEELQDLWNQDPTEAERMLFNLQIAKPAALGDILKIMLTEKAQEELERLLSRAPSQATDFLYCMRSMQYAQLLKDTDCKHMLTDNNNPRSFPSYVYRKGNTTERPFFHTEPGDIMHYPENTVGRVVVERFARHRNRTEYIPSVGELLATPYTQGQDLIELERIFAERRSQQSILVVPMGTLPMIATQLYTLLTKREHRKIERVILIYPGDAGAVRNSVETAKQAFKKEKISCDDIPVEGLRDILSRKDCECYQKALEDLINDLRLNNPGARIDLALTGGRKGMAVLALFAAQRTQLREIFHTLVADEELNEKLAKMDANYFRGESLQKRQDILFLRAYKANESVFRLFKVPIGPLHGI